MQFFGSSLCEVLNFLLLAFVRQHGTIQLRKQKNKVTEKPLGNSLHFIGPLHPSGIKGHPQEKSINKVNFD